MKNKRVAFDVSNLAYRQTGISRVHREIIIRLIKKKNLDCFFYSFSPILKINKFNKKINYFFFSKNKFLKFLWYNFYLPFILRQNNIDYFFCHHRSPLLISKKIKVLLVIHDLTWLKFKSTMSKVNYYMDKIFMPISVKKAHKIIVGTISIKKEVSSFFKLKKNQISYIYWGSIFKKVKKIKKQSFKKVNFLFIGTIEPRKNLKNVIIAFSNLSEKLKNKITFKIIGSSGWGDSDIREVIKREKLSKQIKILNYLSDKDLLKELKKTHYLILISLYEGFGLPIAEAFSQNKPVITSNRGSMKELTGNRGILVNPLSIKDITNKLIKAINSNKDYEKYQKRILAHEGYSWNHTIKKLYKLIN